MNQSQRSDVRGGRPKHTICQPTRYQRASCATLVAMTTAFANQKEVENWNVLHFQFGAMARRMIGNVRYLLSYV